VFVNYRSLDGEARRERVSLCEKISINLSLMVESYMDICKHLFPLPRRNARMLHLET